MVPNPFKTGGPEVDYVVGYVKCCRVWPVVTHTLTWNDADDAWKRESWWVRTCGICKEYPRPVENV